MDFRELNYILAIAKYQNITKAAQSLYIGQPTLSKFLSALEHDLGQPLFRKLGNRYVLTYAGECYVRKAGEILRLKRDLDAELADIISQDKGVLNVAIPSACGTFLLPGTLPAFREKYPNVRVNILEGSLAENEALLLDGRADIAFCARPGTENPLVEYESLSAEEILICTCRDHPVSRYAHHEPTKRYPRLDPVMLKDETVLLLSSNRRMDHLAETGIDSGLKFAHVIRTVSLSAILDMVAQGYGVSFLSESQLRNYPVALPIDCYCFTMENTVSDFAVAYRRGSYLSRYARDYISLVSRMMQKNHE